MAEPLRATNGLAGPAEAGKPTGGTSSGVRVDDGVYAGTTTGYQGASAAKWLHAQCFQGGALVYEQWRSYTGGTATLSLGPTPNWTSGAANCTADEGYFSRNNRWRISGSTTFNAAAS